MATGNEVVTDTPGAAAPPGPPAPPTPTAPATAEVSSDGNSGAEPEEDPDAGARRIIPARIRIVDRRSPDPDRIILRHVDDLRIGGLDLDGGPATVGGGDDPLLARPGPLPPLLRPVAHAADP